MQTRAECEQQECPFNEHRKCRKDRFSLDNDGRCLEFIGRQDLIPRRWVLWDAITSTARSLEEGKPYYQYFDNFIGKMEEWWRDIEVLDKEISMFRVDTEARMLLRVRKAQREDEILRITFLLFAAIRDFWQTREVGKEVEKSPKGDEKLIVQALAKVFNFQGTCLSEADNWKEVQGIIENNCEVLEPREREIIILRSGLKDGQRHTLQEIAERLSLSRERIRQLESKALLKLRRTIREKA